MRYVAQMATVDRGLLKTSKTCKNCIKIKLL